jgi:hypothetical protein
MSRPIARELITGTALGALILGVGGRLAMAAIAWRTGGASSFTLSGTLTVIGLGAASGAAGAVLALISRAVTRRLFPRHPWTHHVLFAVLLLLVTLRGLRGTPGAAHWYFYLLVASYGVAVALLARRNPGGLSC